MSDYICTKCGSDKCFRCTDKITYPNKRYFEYLECGNVSRKVEIHKMRCVNHKSE